jgi:hypothetical protein
MSSPPSALNDSIAIETIGLGLKTATLGLVIGENLESGGEGAGEPAYGDVDHLPDLFPIAKGFRTRLRGLAFRDRADAGPGLLIPRCASVHTFGMRFPLDLYFLDGRGRVISVRCRVPPRRLAWQQGARYVLEIPSAEGGESAAAGT